MQKLKQIQEILVHSKALQGKFEYEEEKTSSSDVPAEERISEPLIFPLPIPERSGTPGIGVPVNDGIELNPGMV
ncbi:hypothetical protein BBF96_12270 [Anoxybacter fermentans]|uniref:Uncharacterized protein n=1 Tax=Anoxybacter fermentans TaxID=1323375 RepID=A0A3Q9HS15_9FIRM|nr:hypothetical protein [Anoxybacter fermentans]AZR74104.1 hypothetical protein BBF96_12270 [Anoxybacter fermentans]